MIQDPSLLLVVQAVYLPGRQLGMLIVLFLILVIVYATVAFRYLRKAHTNQCGTVAHCVLNYLHRGGNSALALSLGYGNSATLGKDTDDVFAMQLIFDITWFVLITNVLLGAVLGLIVDGFSTLKEEKATRAEQLSTITFISTIDRKEIDTAAQEHHGIANGFQYNEEILQPKWNYLAFYCLLVLKPEDEYTGPETYVRKLLDAGDTSWLPTGKSSLLSPKLVVGSGSEEDDEADDFEDADAAQVESPKPAETAEKTGPSFGEDGVLKAHNWFLDELQALRRVVWENCRASGASMVKSPTQTNPGSAGASRL